MIQERRNLSSTIEQNLTGKVSSMCRTLLRNTPQLDRDNNNLNRQKKELKSQQATVRTIQHKDFTQEKNLY